MGLLDSVELADQKLLCYINILSFVPTWNLFAHENEISGLTRETWMAGYIGRTVIAGNALR